MEPKIVTLSDMLVAGIACRTSNEREMKGDGEIPKLWQRYDQEQIFEKIPRPVPGSPTLALYTDYESDVHGMYSLIVGHQVEGADDLLSPDITVKTIPRAAYAVFTSPRGEISRVVIDTWAAIWEWFQQSPYERSYSGDFELYDDRCRDPHQAVVDIYVAIKRT